MWRYSKVLRRQVTLLDEDVSQVRRGARPSCCLCCTSRQCLSSERLTNSVTHERARQNQKKKTHCCSAFRSYPYLLTDGGIAGHDDPGRPPQRGQLNRRQKPIARTRRRM